MSSVQALREFINQRLTAAAAEIFTVFEQTILQYEEEIDRQRKLIEICWKPEIKLQRADHQKQHVCPEEEQLFSQQEASSPDQEKLDSPQIKEEQEELSTSHGGDQLDLSLESGAFMAALANEQGYLSEPDKDCEPPLSLHPADPERRSLKEGRSAESGLDRDAELKVSGRCHGESVDDPPALQKEPESESSTLPYATCSTTFTEQQQVLSHHSPWTDEKKYSCKVCHESFSKSSEFMVHMRSHSDDRPYCCETCGKSFSVHRNMLRHMRTHTGEKPYSCAMCGKSFSKHSNLLRHYRTHTGEKPFSCPMCDKSFRQQSHLLRHRRTHRDEMGLEMLFGK